MIEGCLARAAAPEAVGTFIALAPDDVRDALPALGHERTDWVDSS